MGDVKLASQKPLIFRWIYGILCSMFYVLYANNANQGEHLKMTTEQVITQDPDIHGGIPVFTGTRVPVKSLIDHLKAGDSLDHFLEGFPSVSREQAVAFLEIALTKTI